MALRRASRKTKIYKLGNLWKVMGNITMSGAVASKAGKNVSTSIKEGDWITWISGAEAYINTATRKNWSDIYTTLNDDVKNVIKEAVDNHAAIYAINYDMSGYSSRAEAELMINVLYQTEMDCVKLLVDQKGETFVVGA